MLYLYKEKTVGILEIIVSGSVVATEKMGGSGVDLTCSTSPTINGNSVVDFISMSGGSVVTKVKCSGSRIVIESSIINCLVA